MADSHQGRCLCGEVVFTAKGDANSITNCHCRMCQKATGAPFVTWAEFPAAAVTWSEKEPAWRPSSDTAKRGFCPSCGTPVAFVYNQGEDIDLPSVLFDTPESFAPQDELWTRSRQSWTVLNPQLPHHLQGRDDDA